MTAAFLCTGTHHGFSWSPGNGNKNNMTYITRKAREWVRINGGAYFVKATKYGVVRKCTEVEVSCTVHTKQ